jgi:hypothetical protein
MSPALIWAFESAFPLSVAEEDALSVALLSLEAPLDVSEALSEVLKALETVPEEAATATVVSETTVFVVADTTALVTVTKEFCTLLLLFWIALVGTTDEMDHVPAQHRDGLVSQPSVSCTPC